MTLTNPSTRIRTRSPFPSRQVAAVGLAGFWVAIALAETLLRDGQDALDDVDMIAANGGVIAWAGILQWGAGILLVIGLAGLAPLIWSSLIGRIGWCLTLTMTVGLGAFAMVHLFGVETAAGGLDSAAMNEFLVERIGNGAGPWIVPVLFVGLLGPVSVTILLIGLARNGLTSWVVPVLFGGGAVLHGAVGGELVETGSHWVMAATVVLAAVGIWRADQAVEQASSPARRTFPHRGAAVVGLGTFWIAFAVGEVLTLGGEDALDDVAMIRDNFAVIATAGFAYWLSGMLLAVGLAGLAPLVWSSRLARVGLALSAAVASALGAFSMLQLFALETSAEGLDAEAMNEFLLERLGGETGAGPWMIPIMCVGLFGPLAVAVLLAGLARLGLCSWLLCGVLAAGGVGRLVDQPPIVETLGYAAMGAALIAAALRLRRAPFLG